MTNRKIGIRTDYTTTITNKLILDHTDAARAMSRYATGAQPNFVSLVCDANNVAQGIVRHALGVRNEYVMDPKVSLEALSNISGASQVWFGRNSFYCDLNLIENDRKYYDFFSTQLPLNDIAVRGLIILTPTGNANYFDGQNEFHFSHEIKEDGSIEMPIWGERFV